MAMATLHPPVNISGTTTVNQGYVVARSLEERREVDGKRGRSNAAFKVADCDGGHFVSIEVQVVGGAKPQADVTERR